MSARIRRLEDAVGGPLFARRGRSVVLTTQGESFLPYARRALATLAEGVEATRLALDGERGRVALGIIQSLADAFLAPIITRFHEQSPHVDVVTSLGHTADVLELLSDHVTQVGLVACPIIRADIRTLFRFHESVPLVVSARSPLARRERVTLAEVARFADPFLALRWDALTTATLRRIATQMRSTIEVPSTVARALLLEGRGAAFFPRSLIDDDLRQGRLVALDVDEWDVIGPLIREAACVRLDGAEPLPLATERFVALAREEIARRPWVTLA